MGSTVVDRVPVDTTVDAAVPTTDLGPGVAAAGSPPSPQDSGPRARVITAALRCLSRYGVSKTTVDDIAREAGLSRATLYRVFPGGRDEVLGAATSSELDRFFAEVALRLEGASGLEETLVAALRAGTELVAGHEIVRLLLEREPEAIVPYFSFHGFDLVLSVTREFLAPYFASWMDETEALRVSEWVTRLVFSYLACPSGAAGWTGLESFAPGPTHSRREPAPVAFKPEPIDDERARRLVRQFVMPGIHVLTAAQRSGLN